ncbi:MAG: hypothetical protein SWK76_04740 [Actinomycetota bacterium]|nr:hypothetical protein [Actinomycetota bacterium]
MIKGRPILTLAAAVALCLMLCLTAAGCGSKAKEYAGDARSSYISAKAVLVGLRKFPVEMEALLRSENLETVKEDAAVLTDDANNLINSSAAAFRDCGEKCELLKSEGDMDFDPYADMLLELVGLNEQIINSYSEFISFSSSLAERIPYHGNPQSLMPTLDNMDELSLRIEELDGQVKQLEQQAEDLYRTLVE